MGENGPLKKQGFAFRKINYQLLVVGVVVVAIGYLLMIGGGAEDPNDFFEEELFSTRRITVAPMTILIGFIIVLVGIMKKSKA